MDGKEESEDQPRWPGKGGFLGSFVYDQCPQVPWRLRVKKDRKI